MSAYTPDLSLSLFLSAGVRAHKSESVINEPRLNPITRRGGIFWLVAMHEVPFAGAAYTTATASLVIHFRR